MQLVLGVGASLHRLACLDASSQFERGELLRGAVLATRRVRSGFYAAAAEEDEAQQDEHGDDASHNGADIPVVVAPLAVVAVVFQAAFAVSSAPLAVGVARHSVSIAVARAACAAVRLAANPHSVAQIHRGQTAGGRASAEGKWREARVAQL